MIDSLHANICKTPPWLRVLTSCVLALCLTLSIYVLWRAAVLTPFADELDWIQRWRAD